VTRSLTNIFHIKRPASLSICYCLEFHIIQTSGLFVFMHASTYLLCLVAIVYGLDMRPANSQVIFCDCYCYNMYHCMYQRLYHSLLKVGRPRMAIFDYNCTVKREILACVLFWRLAKNRQYKTATNITF
jgi:hypothetical protein